MNLFHWEITSNLGARPFVYPTNCLKPWAMSSVSCSLLHNVSVAQLRPF